ncbi:hypothetical protein MTP99_019667 [Tenebrio molitor]|nr:hypothetical protein MTP99_019667 [Tenebrio molitor]
MKLPSASGFFSPSRLLTPRRRSSDNVANPPHGRSSTCPTSSCCVFALIRPSRRALPRHVRFQIFGIHDGRGDDEHQEKYLLELDQKPDGS